MSSIIEVVHGTPEEMSAILDKLKNYGGHTPEIVVGPGEDIADGFINATESLRVKLEGIRLLCEQSEERQNGPWVHKNEILAILKKPSP
jgi:hypothetical protein